MQANTSFVVLDPKGEIVRDTGHFLEKHGYEVRVLDLINMEKTHCYNPFVYELTGITDEQAEEVNTLVTSKGGRDKNARIDYFVNNHIGFNFSHVKITPNQDHSVFADNLENVRGDMVEVLNEMLLIQYFTKKKNSKLTDIAATLIETNPPGKRNPEIYYIKAMKDFLYASFAGMTASDRWNGMSVVNGGYIVAKDNGEVLVYHTRDGESFRTFLFNNTKIDRPSASKEKYNYAFVYKKMINIILI